MKVGVRVGGVTAGAVGVTVGVCVSPGARSAVAVGKGAVAVGVGIAVVTAVGVMVGIAVVVAVAVAGSKKSGVTVTNSCSPSTSELPVIVGNGRTDVGGAVHVGHGVAVGDGVQVADGRLVALTTNGRAVGVLLRLGCAAARWGAGALPSAGTVVTESKFIVGSGLTNGVPATSKGETISGVGAGSCCRPCDGWGFSATIVAVFCWDSVGAGKRATAVDGVGFAPALMPSKKLFVMGNAALGAVPARIFGLGSNALDVD